MRGNCAEFGRRDRPRLTLELTHNQYVGSANPVVGSGGFSSVHAHAIEQLIAASHTQNAHPMLEDTRSNQVRRHSAIISTEVVVQTGRSDQLGSLR